MASPNSTALVTGGAGFIGHHIVHALVQNGCKVRVLDDLSTGDVSRLKDVPSVELIQASILDSQNLAYAMRNVDVVFHHAAMVSVPQSVERPLEYHEVNATGTLRVLEAARAAGVRRVIYAATSAAYGDEPTQPKREDLRTLPLSPYAVSKLTGEMYVSAYARLHRMHTISLRYFNVFGPGQNPQSQYGAAIPSIVSRILQNLPPTIYGDGQQTRDFCFVENVVQANLLAAHARTLDGWSVNIACGQRISVNDIVHTANRFLGTNVEPVYAPVRAGDVRDSQADISLARQLLGYQPVVSFEEGMKRSVAWYRRLTADTVAA